MQRNTQLDSVIKDGNKTISAMLQRFSLTPLLGTCQRPQRGTPPRSPHCVDHFLSMSSQLSVVQYLLYHQRCPLPALTRHSGTEAVPCRAWRPSIARGGSCLLPQYCPTFCACCEYHSKHWHYLPLLRHLHRRNPTRLPRVLCSSHCSGNMQVQPSTP